ncbi:MAG: acyltransferase [Muribaculaceae bacterium]|nr:acyltransferase [Muribaculaceae bacterium]
MYFNSLQTLRGFFALMIFFHHFNFKQNEGGMFDAGGDFGVAFFFILSGFVLSKSFLPTISLNLKRANYINFIIKRLSKIYPLHIICLLFAIILKFSISIFDCANLFLLQAWIPIKNWYFSGNAVGWCLSDFLFFYAIFPYVGHLYTKFKQKFINYFCIVTIIYIFLIPLVPENFEDGIIYINPLSRCLDFMFGMVLWGIYNSIKEKNIVISFIDVLFITALSLSIWYLYPNKYNLSLLWWPSVSLIMLYSITSNNKLLSFKPFVKFGNVSFSFYLIHVLAKNYLDIIFNKFNLTFMNPYFRLIIFLIITIIAAFIIHRYFVLPMEKFIRVALNNKNSRQVQKQQIPKINEA